MASRPRHDGRRAGELRPVRIWPDLNLAMTAEGEFVEVQGAAERAAFDAEALRSLLALGAGGIRKLMAIQRQALRRGGR